MKREFPWTVYFVCTYQHVIQILDDGIKVVYEHKYIACRRHRLNAYTYCMVSQRNNEIEEKGCSAVYRSVAGCLQRLRVNILEFL